MHFANVIFIDLLVSKSNMRMVKTV